MSDIFRVPFKKLSEHMNETCPDINPEVYKKAIIAYRDYMFNLRNGKGPDGMSHYCDICYNLISEEEAAKTTMHDFNFCCTEHVKYKNAFQLDRVREEIGLKVEHLPHLDIYG